MSWGHVGGGKNAKQSFFKNSEYKTKSPLKQTATHTETDSRGKRESHEDEGSIQIRARKVRGETENEHPEETWWEI